MKTTLLKKIRKSYSIIHNKRTNSVDVVYINFLGQRKELKGVGGYYITGDTSLEKAIILAKKDLQKYIFNKYSKKFKKTTVINF